MKRFLLLTRNLNGEARPFIEEYVRALQEAGAEVALAENPEDRPGRTRVDIPEGTECVLCVGGDGNMIRSAQNTYGSGIPLIGINLGHLGYLCELDRNTAFTSIPRLIGDDYAIEERMMLAGRIDDESATDALNDIVMASASPMEILRVAVYINGAFLYACNCDGMVLATPTGSTAYNLSAGGPIVDPKTEAILLTPLNPHSLNVRSIVLDPCDEIALEIRPRHEQDTPRALLTFDGGHARNLMPKERLVVRKAHKKMRLIRLSEVNFLERMRAKMQE